MTDYGRSPGPEPWHPDDPLYGDQGWDRGQTGHGGWDQYGNPVPQQPYPDAQHYPGQQQYPQAPYPGQQYADPGYADPHYAGGQQYPQQPHWDGQQQYDWSGQHTVPTHDGYAVGVAETYGQPPAQADPYGHGGYVPQQPAPQSEPEQTAEWAAFHEEAEEPERHPFFTGTSLADYQEDERERFVANDDDDDEYEDEPDDERNTRKGKKKRSGCAVLVALLVLVGLVGGVGYGGYWYWQRHFAAAPDFSGDGTGDVQVVIPNGATLAQMGNILKRNDVVKSVDAFTKAAGGKPLQGGVYMLHKEMSAAAAVAMMLNPSSQNALIIPEGSRATRIYQAIDQKLGLPSGTTENAAKGADLGLPSYANGNPEGFLFPMRYSIGKSTKPVDFLKQMVQQAEAEYGKDDLEAQAAKVGKTPYEVIIIASLIQAEAQERQDFYKVSRVIYNRLDQNMALGFDSTINYAKGRSTLNTTNSDTKFNSPYNTYLHKGLPPGPIDNPGHLAIDAALHPADGNWLYFVTVKPGDTRFTNDYAEHQRNVAEFNKYQREHGG
ncbi:endolytic transglycosylase MltG [Streptantibioticus rubrisoli]|uniref:Endolytic murein transglycosylase n=1 Tax=Streptantibioticus rubrisoli TaxID=1387313 RepID=A0ABT1PFQ8_9ACTN|nr:endolytic transglycosylase MltG [Streptantibioticus rubrisoli]MCQ4044201.1 endolytic transglycosylase MltG [Streptantibioticus rubrisoli]